MTTVLTSAPAAAPSPPGRVRRLVRRATSPWTYAALVAILAGSAFPVYWSFVVSSQTTEAVGSVPPVLVPGGHLFENIARVFDETNFALALGNSLIVAGTITVSVVLFSTLAGFAFAKLKFRGRTFLLLLVVATQAIPTELGVVPLYMMMADFGWAGQLQAVIVPGLVTAFGVFFMRQYFERALPLELLEAGRMDGCGSLRLFWHVALPAARPAAAVLGLFTFMQAWNDFFWPLVVLVPENPTVQTALSSLASGYTTDYTLVLTAATIGTVPVLLVFLLFGRQIVGGIMQGALKG
ncbi:MULTISPECIES: carbohydrate ABC transporter permease [Amycolatopsis]|uniref:Carbohydrate ABC transporter permease n=1 Tax=Amycolatopsis eburnea TaxID=2267691 RepID=A0A427SVW9_9PSEU|nr:MULTISPECIES: carbohydrate ABC transporter permease [Amycolatopsis]NBH04949.1 ABC transporter permease subunit [Amycolatopsis sp. SID8362]NED41649.1 carbohydrate ABC transporter permease [Amycolatopsis sp. SID8362]RSD08386.1 carbohydrate ABC transporter permease [Amycolatopsis eburnea]